mmetsp:Transcript_4864/g.19493  ORF Transcript_4864/g.19493 Transcript_4864/m.19493 type:complete len:450 (-) Transcript_4864:531-1880(-)
MPRGIDVGHIVSRDHDARDGKCGESFAHFPVVRRKVRTGFRRPVMEHHHDVLVLVHRDRIPVLGRQGQHVIIWYTVEHLLHSGDLLGRRRSRRPLRFVRRAHAHFGDDLCRVLLTGDLPVQKVDNEAREGLSVDGRIFRESHLSVVQRVPGQRRQGRCAPVDAQDLHPVGKGHTIRKDAEYPAPEFLRDRVKLLQQTAVLELTAGSLLDPPGQIQEEHEHGKAQAGVHGKVGWRELLERWDAVPLHPSVHALLHVVRHAELLEGGRDRPRKDAPKSPAHAVPHRPDAKLGVRVVFARPRVLHASAILQEQRRGAVYVSFSDQCICKLPAHNACKVNIVPLLKAVGGLFELLKLLVLHVRVPKDAHHIRGDHSGIQAIFALAALPIQELPNPLHLCESRRDGLQQHLLLQEQQHVLRATASLVAAPEGPVPKEHEIGQCRAEAVSLGQLV